MKVKDIMIKRVVTAKGGLSLQQAIETLYEKHVGSLIILDEEKICEGIFTERDAISSIARKIDLQTPICEVMTKRVLTVHEGASFATAKNIMVEHRIRHLPVKNRENKIVGIVTMRNIVDELIGYPTVKD